MSKIKLNLVSGSVIEKKLISSFKVENETYLILDNESVGSMGLPIILVSKIFDNKIVKIVDQEEWQKVKEYLKNIIAGNNMNYVSLPDELGAEEVFYTQLTLPIPSFEALKNNYVISGGASENVVNPSEVPIAPEIPIPVGESSQMPQPEPIPQSDPHSVNESVVGAPSMSEVTNVLEQQPITPVTAPEIPAVEPINPIIPEVPVAPVTSGPALDDFVNPPVDTVVNPEINQTIPITPEQVVEPKVDAPIANTPIMAPNAETSTSIKLGNPEYAEIKDAFMKACENMFEALIVKFENKN